MRSAPARSATRRSRDRCSVHMSSCLPFFNSTNRMVRRVAASATPLRRGRRSSAPSIRTAIFRRHQSDLMPQINKDPAQITPAIASLQRHDTGRRSAKAGCPSRFIGRRYTAAAALSKPTRLQTFLPRSVPRIAMFLIAPLRLS